MSIPGEKDLGDAIATVLQGVLGADRAANSKVPPGGGRVGSTFKSYAVVWPGTSLRMRPGTVTAPNADAAQIVQVSYVGHDADAANLARDAGRAALLTSPTATPLVVPGRSVWLVELEQGLPAGEDTSLPAPARPWLAVDLYAIETTPA